MKNIYKAPNVAAIWCLFVATLAGCSGGAASSNALLGGGAPSHTGPTNPVPGSAVKRQFSIFIPQKPATSATSVKSAASTRRLPQYVSYGTQGVGIVTLRNDQQVDSESFSTNGDNPKCAKRVTLKGGITCTFTVGVLAGEDEIAVFAYNVEPTAPTGGNTTAFPPGAQLLSGNFASLTIDPGVNTPIPLVLDGVPASAQLVSNEYAPLSATGDVAR